MIKSLSTAATGMQGQEMRLDQIAQDMANMNTNAYKRGRTEFQDLMYQTIKEPGGPGQGQSPVGVQVGSGVKVAAQYSIYDQGNTKVTNNLFDIAINGEGFLPIQLPTGEVAYTRDGALKLDAEGRLTTNGGYPIVPNITIPRGVANVTITDRGEVRVLTAAGGEQVIGNLQLVSFINPSATRKVAGNIVVATTASGPPIQGNPGENGLGALQQGALESSNVKPTEAVMDMITTQRTYETNARIMSVGDQMWSTTNNIGNR